MLILDAEECGEEVLARDASTGEKANLSKVERRNGLAKRGVSDAYFYRKVLSVIDLLSFDF